VAVDADVADQIVERYHRDVPLMTIGEGASEMQKLVIARQLRDRCRAG
jgi:alkylation response protein AidB-like acyl-CoA dehydrogenase